MVLKYDCVVRLRTDEYFYTPIGSLDNYDLNTVNVLNEWAHVEHGINDHFAFGSSELMDKYLDVFETLLRFVRWVQRSTLSVSLGSMLKRDTNFLSLKNPWHYVLWRDKK